MSNNDEETARPIVTSQKSVTMEYFLESRNLDKETKTLLLKYDEDGNGRFSKDEVVEIICDLKSTKQHNDLLEASAKFYKRLFIGACVFCILLLTGMFGLSYSVAVLTSNTFVKQDGTMSTPNGEHYIATDSKANTYKKEKNDLGRYCLSKEEAETIKNQVLEGRNVLVELAQYNQTNGHSLFEQLKAEGADIDEDEGMYCFQSPSSGQVCIMKDYDFECLPKEERERRLNHGGGHGGGGKTSETLASTDTIDYLMCPGNC